MRKFFEKYRRKYLKCRKNKHFSAFFSAAETLKSYEKQKKYSYFPLFIIIFLLRGNTLLLLLLLLYVRIRLSLSPSQRLRDGFVNISIRRSGCQCDIRDS